MDINYLVFEFEPLGEDIDGGVSNQRCACKNGGGGCIVDRCRATEVGLREFNLGVSWRNNRIIGRFGSVKDRGVSFQCLPLNPSDESTSEQRAGNERLA